MNIRILRLPEVLSRRGRSRTCHYEDIRNRRFTKAIKLGGDRSVGWPEHEVDAVNAATIAGWSDDKIRDLVKRLEAARLTAADAFRSVP